MAWSQTHAAAMTQTWVSRGVRDERVTTGCKALDAKQCALSVELMFDKAHFVAAKGLYTY